jgi:ATP-dependent DNA helicase RecG
MTYETPLQELRGIGAATLSKFAILGLKTAGDCIVNYPRTYQDYSDITPVAALRPGLVSVEVEIKQVVGRYVRRGMHITEAIASDESGSVRIVWFNQPYRAGAIKSQQTYYVSGNFELSKGRFTIMNPSLELKSDFPISTARIVPIYRETKGLTSRQIRQVVQQLLPLIANLPETLPAWLIADNQLLSRSEALRIIHFPESAQDLQAAQRRLGFEEVFRLTLASVLNKRDNQQYEAVKIPFDVALAKTFVSELPFKLTDAQRTAIWQIYGDLDKTMPMNRLLEGDVGSGKTVVAAMAAVMVMAAGKQVAFMAPTELLARQHAETLVAMLKPLGYDTKSSLLVGSMSKAQKQLVHKAITSGACQLIIGTHALIQDAVVLHDLALVIVDEQHRFGVEQRKTLMAKADLMPHVLSMTATPIPRSLALTLYGELDISIIAQKPGGRLSIITELISPNSRQQVYDQIEKQLQTGRQMFVVCPLISESSALDAQAAETVYEQIAKKDFKKWRVGLLHGKMKADAKNLVMEQFVNHELDILVATTVIEVGVDVPNASVMLVETPERFGLAQIHQLRGRVGRSEHQGYCYLLLSDSKQPSKRLRALRSTSDGFKLAELDLELRGPGAIYGTMQHGALDLRIAKLTDTDLIAAARQGAQAFLDKGENLVHYKELNSHVTRLRTVTNLN